MTSQNPGLTSPDERMLITITRPDDWHLTCATAQRCGLFCRTARASLRGPS
jgi:hypothetical protein